MKTKLQQQVLAPKLKNKMLEKDLNNNCSPLPPKASGKFVLCSELLKESLSTSALKMDFGSLLGKGGFGSVYCGTFANRQVAIKVLDRQNNNVAAKDESYLAELRVLTLNHPSIVKTLAVSTQSLAEQTGSALIVMEYIPGRNLLDLICSPEEGLPPVRRVKYALQLTRALEYAHRNCIVHLDFKPANVLITPDDNCKLGDFGCCQRVEMSTGTTSPTQRSVLTGTIAYRAPEILKGEAPTLKSDIYSVGITLWQMLSRQIPHGGVKHPHVIVFGVVAYNLRPHLVNVEGNPFELYYTEMYTECWAACPNERPATKDLIEVLHVWQRYL